MAYGRLTDVLGWSTHQDALDIQPANRFILGDNYMLTASTAVSINPQEFIHSQRNTIFKLVNKPQGVVTSVDVGNRFTELKSGLASLPENWQAVTGRRYFSQ